MGSNPMLVLRIGALPPGLNSSGGGSKNKKRSEGLLHMHFTDYSDMKKQWASIVQNAVQMGTPVGWEGFGVGPVWMMVVRFSTGVMDMDNLYSSMKVVLDGLVRAGVMLDDNEVILPWPRIVQVKVPRMEQSGLIIAIRKMTNEEINEVVTMRTWAKSIGTPTAGITDGMLQDH
jgi:Holliday junction resolvase RusA-like endonuclease